MVVVVVLEVELAVQVVVLEVKLVVLEVKLMVELVVAVVVMEAHSGPRNHMARMMMMNVSQGARPPALKEPTLGSPGSPDLVSSYSWMVPLHVMVLWSMEKADGQ